MTAPVTAAWTADDATFPARLALIRQRMGWGNVTEAAVACGVPVESWRNWERDGRKPHDYIGVCEKVSAASGCDYGWLVNRRPSGAPFEAPKPVNDGDSRGYGLQFPRLVVAA
jgi:hypothetical protein